MYAIRACFASGTLRCTTNCTTFCWTSKDGPSRASRYAVCQVQKPVVGTRSPAPGGHDGHRGQRPRCGPVSASSVLSRALVRSSSSAMGVIQWDGVSCHHLPWRFFKANAQRPTRRTDRHRIVGSRVERAAPHSACLCLRAGCKLRRPRHCPLSEPHQKRLVASIGEEQLECNIDPPY